MAKSASAKHLLVASETLCEDIKKQILNGGVTFEEAAKQHSSCPSKAEGGSLGTFSKGQMVAEFDKVVFNDEIGVVHGPIKTQFGYHLLEIIDRKD